MKGAIINVSGNWAHFKKPETNNNPLTHDFITKTALIGLVGAVLGIERNEMKPLFPTLSSSILYGVQVVNPVKKLSWGFTSRSAVHPTGKGSPKYFEILKEPYFKVAIAAKANESVDIFNDFIKAVRDSRSIFNPVLGWHNCPAELTIEYEGEFSEIQNGKFAAKCFFSTHHKPDLFSTENLRVGFEKIPTFQNEDFWNLPGKYVEVIYPTSNESIWVEGEYYNFVDKMQWWLV